MAFYNIFVLFVLVNFTFAITESQDDPFYVNLFCSGNRTSQQELTANTSFQAHLTTLLSSLSSHAIGDTQFYITTLAGNNVSHTIYGMFMCRGDVPSQLCQKCVVEATQRLFPECYLYNKAGILYEECFVYYSTSPFFSTVVTKPYFPSWKSGEVSNPQRFMQLLFSTMNKTADEAAQALIGDKKFATGEATISEF